MSNEQLNSRSISAPSKPSSVRRTNVKHYITFRFKFYFNSPSCPYVLRKSEKFIDALLEALKKPARVNDSTELIYNKDNIVDVVSITLTALSDYNVRLNEAIQNLIKNKFIRYSIDNVWQQAVEYYEFNIELKTVQTSKVIELALNPYEISSVYDRRNNCMALRCAYELPDKSGFMPPPGFIHCVNNKLGKPVRKLYNVDLAIIAQINPVMCTSASTSTTTSSTTLKALSSLSSAPSDSVGINNNPTAENLELRKQIDMLNVVDITNRDLCEKGLELYLYLVNEKEKRRIEYEMTLILLALRSKYITEHYQKIQFSVRYENLNSGGRIILFFSHHRFFWHDAYNENDLQTQCEKLIMNLLLELQLQSEYEYGGFLLSPLFTNVMLEQKKNISIYSEGIVKTSVSSSNTSKATNAKPGLTITICRNVEHGFAELGGLQYDSDFLCNLLNTTPLRLDLNGHQVEIRPILVVARIMQSFTLAIPDLKLDNEKRDQLIGLLRQRLGETELKNKYFVSSISFQEDIYNSSDEVLKTTNSKALEIIGMVDTEIPEEFLCALTQQIMSEPVKLPDCDVIIDKRALVSAYSRNPVNPFTRKIIDNPLGIKVDQTLKHRIDSFVEAKVFECFASFSVRGETNTYLMHDTKETQSVTLVQAASYSSSETQSVLSSSIETSAVPQANLYGNLFLSNPNTQNVENVLSVKNNLVKLLHEMLDSNNTQSKILDAIRTDDFNLVLRRACAYGNIAVVKLLIDNNAIAKLNLDINSTSTNGNSAYDWAVQSGNNSLITLLEDHGAKSAKISTNKVSGMISATKVKVARNRASEDCLIWITSGGRQFKLLFLQIGLLNGLYTFTY